MVNEKPESLKGFANWECLKDWFCSKRQELALASLELALEVWALNVSKQQENFSEKSSEHSLET